MTKVQLLAEMAATYKVVGTPALQSTSDEVGTYLVNVVETGLSAKLKKPTCYRRNIAFYVYKEGNGLEEAFYDRDELNNTVNNDITGDGSLFSIHKVFASGLIQARVQAAVAIASQDIINEAPETTNHSARVKWASAALLNPAQYTLTMTSFIAQNATIQAAGGVATDNDIKYVVNSFINKVALAAGF